MFSVGIVRRLWAIAALAALAGSVGLALAITIEGFPRGITVLACLALAAFAAWRALLALGLARRLWAALAAASALAAIALVLIEGRPLGNAIVIVLFALSIPAAREAFRVHAPLPSVPPPRRAVLFYN